MSIVVLTGGPGAGKSTVAMAVAQLRERCAVIEVDDLRQMLVQPHVPPWEGAEGLRQQRLGVANASLMAGTFATDGADVVIADVLTDETAAHYRQALDAASVSIVHLTVPCSLAHERAIARHYSLTDDQFRSLHAAQDHFRDFDVQIDTSTSPVQESAEIVSSLLG
jgi:predicted kinase